MAFTKIVGAGIHTLSNVHTHNINSSGIITATNFVGPFDGTTGDFSGNVTIGGNLVVNGDTTTLNTTLREVELLRVDAQNDNVAAGIITQRGTGNILDLYDTSSAVFSVRDGGNIIMGASAGSVDPHAPLHIRTATTGAITSLLKLHGPFTSNTGSEGTAIDFGTAADTSTGARIIGSREAAGAKGALRFCTGRENDSGFNNGRMVIDETGRVGINSTSPANKLDVALGAAWIYPNENGDEAVALKLGKLEGYTDSLNDILVSDDNDSVTNRINRYVGNWYFDRTTSPGATRLNAFQLKAHDSGAAVGNSFTIRDLKNTADSFKFWTNGNSFVGVTTDGTSRNFGIGTNNPTERLTVYGTNSDTTPILGLRSGNNHATTNNGAQIAFGHAGINHYQHFIHTRHNGSNEHNAIDFYVCDGTQQNTVTSGSVHTLSMVSGKVGINSTSPREKLDIIGNANVIVDNNKGIKLGYRGESKTAYIGIDANDNANAGSQSWGNSAYIGFYSDGSSERSITYRTSAGSHIFQGVNGTEFARITSSGNVGIGTDNIDAKLKVRTAGVNKTLFTLEADLGTNNNRALYIKSPTTDSASEPFTFHTGNSIQFMTDANIGLKIHSDGKVGIGTNNPNNPLTIHASGNHIYLKDTATDNNLQIRSSGGVAEFNSFGTGGARRDFVFNQYASEVLRIKSNGKLLVGIHTTSEAYTWSPRARFAVESAGDASSIHLGLRYAGGADPAIMMLRRGGSSPWVHHIGRIYTDYYPTMHFQTSFSAAPGSENFQIGMAIKHNVGVGIGTDDPKLKLHVHQNNSNASFAHFTNTSTGYNSNQGLSVGIDSDENAVMYHYGSKNIRFATDNTQHMVLRSTGQLGIGTAFNPIADSKKLTLLCDSVGDGIWIANKENLYNAASTGYSDVRFTFYDYQTGGYTAGGEAIIRAHSRNAYAGSRSADLIFMTSPSDGSGTATEKLRITSDGQVQIPGGSTPFKVTHTGADCAQFHRGSKYLGINADWGGNTGDAVITVSDNFVIHTGGSNERLRIDSSGKLGVGNFSSTSIAQALHVRGSAPEIYLEHTGGHDLTLTTSDGMGMNGITVNGGFLSLAYNNKDIVMCRTGGSVGINTTSPSRKLVVVDNLGGGIGVVGSNAGIYMGEHHTGGFQNNCAIARAAANNYHISGSTPGDLCIAGESTKALIFGTSAHAGAMAERLRISHDGKVRIGNTNITVQGAADDLIIGPNTPAGDHGVTIVSGTSGTGNIYFADTNTASYGNRMGTISYYHNGNFMRFSTSGNKEALRLGERGNMTTATGSFRSRQEIKVDTLHMPQAHEGYATDSGNSGRSVATNIFHQSHVRGTSHLTTELFSTRMGHNAGIFVFVEVWFSCAVSNFQGYQALWANANRTGSNNFTINNTGQEGHQLGSNTGNYFDLTYASSGSGGDQRLTWKVVTSFPHNYVRCLYKSTVVGHDYFVDFTTIR